MRHRQRDGAAAQHDGSGRAEGPQVGPGIGVVDHQVGRVALLQHMEGDSGRWPSEGTGPMAQFGQQVQVDVAAVIIDIVVARSTTSRPAT